MFCLIICCSMMYIEFQSQSCFVIFKLSWWCHMYIFSSFIIKHHVFLFKIQSKMLSRIIKSFFFISDISSSLEISYETWKYQLYYCLSSSIVIIDHNWNNWSELMKLENLLSLWNYFIEVVSILRCSKWNQYSYIVLTWLRSILSANCSVISLNLWSSVWRWDWHTWVLSFFIS